MDIVPSHRSRLLHLLIAIFATAGFLVLIRLLPSLKTGTDAGVVVRCVVEIMAPVVLLWALIRSGEPRAPFGVKRFRLASVGWALLCFLIIAILSIVTLFAFSRYGIAQDKATLASLASRPVPIMLLIAATAGIAEEIIFRSVLIAELEAATGMKWLAALLSLIVFALAHAAGWGPTQVIFAAVPGLVLTLFFLWKRDLWLCIIAHFLTDALGLLSAAAAMAHHAS